MFFCFSVYIFTFNYKNITLFSFCFLISKVYITVETEFFVIITENCERASPGAAVKLCLGDLLVMGSNPETASLHMQG